MLSGHRPLHRIAHGGTRQRAQVQKQRKLDRWTHLFQAANAPSRGVCLRRRRDRVNSMRAAGQVIVAQSTAAQHPPACWRHTNGAACHAHAGCCYTRERSCPGAAGICICIYITQCCRMTTHEWRQRMRPLLLLLPPALTTSMQHCCRAAAVLLLLYCSYATAVLLLRYCHCATAALLQYNKAHLCGTPAPWTGTRGRAGGAGPSRASPVTVGFVSYVG